MVHWNINSVSNENTASCQMKSRQNVAALRLWHDPSLSETWPRADTNDLSRLQFKLHIKIYFLRHSQHGLSIPYATGLNFSCHLIILNCWATIVVLGRLRVKHQPIGAIQGNFLRGGTVGWRIALTAGRSRIRFPMRSLRFFVDFTLQAALWLCGRLSL